MGESVEENSITYDPSRQPTAHLDDPAAMADANLVRGRWSKKLRLHNSRTSEEEAELASDSPVESRSSLNERRRSNSAVARIYRTLAGFKKEDDVLASQPFSQKPDMAVHQKLLTLTMVGSRRRSVSVPDLLRLSFPPPPAAAVRHNAAMRLRSKSVTSLVEDAAAPPRQPPPFTLSTQTLPVRSPLLSGPSHRIASPSRRLASSSHRFSDPSSSLLSPSQRFGNAAASKHQRNASFPLAPRQMTNAQRLESRSIAISSKLASRSVAFPHNPSRRSASREFPKRRQSLRTATLTTSAANLVKTEKQKLERSGSYKTKPSKLSRRSSASIVFRKIRTSLTPYERAQKAEGSKVVRASNINK